MHEQITLTICGTILSQMPEALAIYRFGTWGTENERKESDIDLAILLPQPIKSLTLWTLSQDLARQINKEVDLIDLRQASTVMRMQIVAHGKRLFCANEYECERFEDYVFSSYIRFNEERREILEDIKQRGSIYGG